MRVGERGDGKGIVEDAPVIELVLSVEEAWWLCGVQSSAV